MNKKSYIGAVFFDVDGTLLDEKCNIFTPTDKTKEAIERLKQNGYLTCVATGRAKCYMADVDIKFDGYITCNGAVAEVDGDVFYRNVFDSDSKVRLVEYLEENGFAYNLETREICYYGESRAELMKGMLEIFSITKNCFAPLTDPASVQASKSMVIFENDKMFDELLKKFGNDFLIIKHRGYPSADINSPGITKATGMREIMKRYGIPLENTYAFGDAGNDYFMLEAAGHGIAMTPHEAELDSVAEFVTGTVADEGIYTALNHFGII